MVSRLPSKSREHLDNHELILDAAGELLRDVGYKRMTIDELAKHAGLGKGTVYLYFESKQEVALSFIDRSNIRLQGNLRSILRNGGSTRERLGRMLVERVMIRFEAVQGLKEGIDDLLICLRPQLFERRTKWMAAEARIFAELLIEGRTRGEFAFSDAFQTADAFLDATNSLLPHSLSPKQLGERNQLLERTTVLADLLVKSVNPNSEGKRNPHDPRRIDRP